MWKIRIPRTTLVLEISVVLKNTKTLQDYDKEFKKSYPSDEYLNWRKTQENMKAERAARIDDDKVRPIPIINPNPPSFRELRTSTTVDPSNFTHNL
jgi:hypothetical protein